MKNKKIKNLILFGTLIIILPFFLFPFWKQLELKTIYARTPYGMEDYNKDLKIKNFEAKKTFNKYWYIPFTKIEFTISGKCLWDDKTAKWSWIDLEDAYYTKGILTEVSDVIISQKEFMPNLGASYASIGVNYTILPYVPLNLSPFNGYAKFEVACSVMGNIYEF